MSSKKGLNGKVSFFFFVRTNLINFVIKHKAPFMNSNFILIIHMVADDMATGNDLIC